MSKQKLETMIKNRINIINILHRAKGCKLVDGVLITKELHLNIDKIESIKMNSSIAYRDDFEIETVSGVSINYYNDNGTFEISI